MRSDRDARLSLDGTGTPYIMEASPFDLILSEICDAVYDEETDEETLVTRGAILALQRALDLASRTAGHGNGIFLAQAGDHPQAREMNVDALEFSASFSEGADRRYREVASGNAVPLYFAYISELKEQAKASWGISDVTTRAQHLSYVVHQVLRFSLAVGITQPLFAKELQASLVSHPSEWWSPLEETSEEKVALHQYGEAPVGMYLLVCQKWEEVEVGWGERPDGYSLHLSLEDLESFVASHWEKWPDKLPAEYSQPCGTPFECPVDYETYRQVQESPRGFLYEGHAPFDPCIDGWCPGGQGVDDDLA